MIWYVAIRANKSRRTFLTLTVRKRFFINKKSTTKAVTICTTKRVIEGKAAKTPIYNKMVSIFRSLKINFLNHKKIYYLRNPDFLVVF